MHNRFLIDITFFTKSFYLHEMLHYCIGIISCLISYLCYFIIYGIECKHHLTFIPTTTYEHFGICWIYFFGIWLYLLYICSLLYTITVYVWFFFFFLIKVKFYFLKLVFQLPVERKKKNGYNIIKGLKWY